MCRLVLIIVHRQEKRSDGMLSLREVAKGSGDCCGGAQVDAAFLALLKETIPVFEAYSAAHPAEVLRTVMAKFELAKRSFDGSGDVVLPHKLLRLWYDHKMAQCGIDGGQVGAAFLAKFPCAGCMVTNAVIAS